MIVEVAEQTKLYEYDIAGKLVDYANIPGSYDEEACIEGCCLGFTLSGQLFNLPFINQFHKRAVYCNHCYATRHLRLFKEIKL